MVKIFIENDCIKKAFSPLYNWKISLGNYVVVMLVVVVLFSFLGNLLS